MTAWYAGLLAGSLLLSGAFIYLGLENYLQRNLRTNLQEQAVSVADEVLEHANTETQSKIPSLLKQRFASQLNGRFIRLLAADGTVIYISAIPADGSFDPATVPISQNRSKQPYSDDEHLPDYRRVLIAGVPIVTAQGKPLFVEVGALYKPIEGVLQGLLLNIALLMPLMIVVAVVGGYLVMRSALRPVDEITMLAERISSRNLGERLPVIKTGDELERLSTSLNRMIARLESAFQHINRFSADVSHELRTPLTILRGELEAAGRGRRLDADLLEIIGSALEEIERLVRISDQLLAISRLDAGEARIDRAVVDLGELAVSTAEQMQLLAEEKPIEMRYRISKLVRVEGDPSRLKQVVVNLLDNAVKYTAPGGWVQVTVEAEGSNAILDIADNGVGIPTEALPHIFERFYRADKARSRDSGGTGLGLSIVHAICTAHGGKITVFSAEGQGTRFHVELPLFYDDSAFNKTEKRHLKLAGNIIERRQPSITG